MNKVRNRNVIRRIADKTRKATKMRNGIAIIAIALTCILFTAVFTIGNSILVKQQESTMRQVGGTSHAGYKYLTQAEYDIVKQDSKLKNISCRILVGDAINDDLKKVHTEVFYYEELDAKMGFCYPEVGHMPEEEMELVTSDLVLQALGVPCKIGETVPLKLKIGNTIVEEQFVLSGYFYGDTVASAQVIAVSKRYQERVAPTPEHSVMGRVIGNPEDIVGRIMADFNFEHSVNLEKQLTELTERCGFPETVDYGINWAYVGENIAPEMVLMAIVLIIVILLSGYLIIYNIFYINVFSEIRHYGLLKIIGTTEKQLKRIVRRQAYVLSAFGVPIGLLAGAWIGKCLLPFIMSELTFGSRTNSEVELNVWVFIGSAVFSFLTVYISCIKPCNIAAKVTPIEAIRTIEGMQNQQVETRTSKRKRQKKTGRKRTRKVTARNMAYENIKRNRKKVVVVVASLTLSFVLLNSIYTILQAFSMERYVSSMVVSDFVVNDATLDNSSVEISSRVTDGVTEEFLKQLDKQEGVTDVGNIYLHEGYVNFAEEDWRKVRERVIYIEPVLNEIKYLYGMTPNMTAQDYLDELEETKTIDGKVYGINELVMNNLEQVDGVLDWEKFISGDYVIATRYTKDEVQIDYFEQGETVTIFNENGESRQYEVMAVVEIPSACRYRVYGIFDCTYILPEEEFFDFMGKKQPMRTLIEVKEEQEAQFEKWLDSYCTTINTDLDYASKEKLVNEFEATKDMYVVVGGVLVFILAFIGILNFVNTMLTSMITRKQEMAMMEAVGMTGKQQVKMLMWEGVLYASFAGVSSLVIGSLLSVAVIRKMTEALYFFVWKFSVLPIIVSIPILMIIVCIVPMISYRNIQKVSVVERIRTVY